MNRLAIIAATGVLALMLTACGEDKTAKPTEVKTETTVEVPANDTTKPAEENKGTEAQPTEAQPTTDAQPAQ